MRESWTQAHDLALIYIALAYGTDSELSETELRTITDAIATWRTDLSRVEVNEIVLEAVAVFLEGNPRTEVVNSMQTLKEALTVEQRRRALDDIVRIAESDGVLLHRERGLITFLASIWEMKATGMRLIEQISVPEEQVPTWSLLHDISLMYVVMAHSTDNNLSEPEI
ncbi:MAG TPA: TerB family tellurite resistance protein, partial [Rhodothermales bacterium]